MRVTANIGHTIKCCAILPEDLTAAVQSKGGMAHHLIVSSIHVTYTGAYLIQEMVLTIVEISQTDAASDVKRYVTVKPYNGTAFAKFLFMKDNYLNVKK